MRGEEVTAALAVAVVEVAVEHQHPEAPQLVERPRANLVRPGHANTALSPTAGFVNTMRPPTIEAATAPRSSHPSNGVFFDFDRRLAALIVTRASGARIVTSAAPPAAGGAPG